MTTSGTKTFELDIDDYIEEAFERCGLVVRGGYDLKTARRSLNILLAEWANRGLNQWTIKNRSVSMQAGVGDYTLEPDIIDIMNIIVQRGDTSYTIDRLSRGEYLAIPNKDTRSQINQFFLDRQVTPVLRLWPRPDNDTDVVTYDALTRIDDAGAYSNTVDMPFRFYPCLAAGLAYYIAVKKAPDRVPLLQQMYEQEFERAALEDRDRSSFNILPDSRSARSWGGL